MTTERTNDGRGCVENDSGGAGDFIYALFDDSGYVYELPAGLLDDVVANLGTHGNGWILRRVYLSTLH